jgi:hypothetical protein
MLDHTFDPPVGYSGALFRTRTGDPFLTIPAFPAICGNSTHVESGGFAGLSRLERLAGFR